MLHFNKLSTFFLFVFCVMSTGECSEKDTDRKNIVSVEVSSSTPSMTLRQSNDWEEDDDEEDMSYNNRF